MSEKYYYNYYDDKYDYIHKFELVIGIKKRRFQNEGVLQEVILYLDNCPTFYTNFGRHHLLNLLTDGTFSSNTQFIDNFYFDIKQRFVRIIMSERPYIDLQIKDYDFDKFYEWLVESLTPLEQKRKEKIEEIKKNIKLLDKKI